MSYSYNTGYIPWKPNKLVFTFGLIDLSTIRKFSTKLYEETVNLLPIKARRQLLKNCYIAAADQANIAITKMINGDK